MRRHSRSRLSGLLTLLSVCSLALQASATPKNLPEGVTHARSVFIANETGFVELEYTAILELNKWGRFEIAESREKADLILRLDNGSHVRALPEGQFPGTSGNSFGDGDIPKGHTRVALLDPKSNATLWSGSHKTDGGRVKSGHLLDELREAFDSYDKGRR
jgi:hypothetical protein